MHEPTLPEPTEIYARAWRDFSENLGHLMVAVLIGCGAVVVLYIGMAIAMGGLMFLLRANQVALQIATNAVSGVFALVVMWGTIGFMRFCLDVTRGMQPEFTSLFEHWRLVPNYFLTNSVIQLFSFLALLPLGLLVGGPIAATWDPSNPIPAILFGMGGYLVGIVALAPLWLAALGGLLFAIDRELDPLACFMVGLRAVRKNLGWTYLSLLFAILAYLATVVLTMTCVGLFVAIPFGTLVVVHYYLAMADAVEARLIGPEGPAVEAPKKEYVEEEAAGEVQPGVRAANPYEPEVAANPYLPPSANVDQPYGPSGGDTGRPAAAALPVGVHRFRPAAPAAVTGIAVLCLIPWVLAGGNPFSGGMVGFQVARALGFPDWAGAVAGFGGLTLCGVAAAVVLLLGHRGRREVIVDEEGFALDGNKLWTGLRLRWDEVRGFRINPRGVELYPTGAWGWFWRPIVPTRERETHDLVAALEAHKIPRV